MLNSPACRTSTWGLVWCYLVGHLINLPVQRLNKAVGLTSSSKGEYCSSSDELSLTDSGVRGASPADCDTNTDVGELNAVSW